MSQAHTPRGEPVSRSVLVTGGTGTLGREVVRHLLDGGHRVTVASRRAPGARTPDSVLADRTVTVDYRDGTGLDAAASSADTIVHCATSYTGRHGGEPALARGVLSAARRAGCAHIVYISIVGVDRVPLNYYRAKLETERLVVDSGLAWTILRATQFHDLVLRAVSALTRPPVALVPAVPLQPVHAAEVGARLAELTAGPPVGRAPDMGGPEVRDLPDLARAYLRAAGRRRGVLPVRLPGAVFRAYRAGQHLAPAEAVGDVTFERFLSRRRPPR